MKTSRIIVIAFGLFLIGGMLFLYIDAKQNEKETNKATAYKEFMLPAFKVVVAERESNFNIEKCDTNKLKIDYVKTEKLPAQLYRIKNDTLYVMGKVKKMTLYAQGVKAILGHKNCWVSGYKLTADTLNIYATGGRIYLNNEGLLSKKKSNLNINVFANDSAYIEVSNTEAKNINVKSANSEVKLFGNINSLSANLMRHSELYSEHTPRVTKVEADSTSGVTMYR